MAARNVDRRRLVLAFSLLLVLSNTLAALAPDIHTLMLARALLGVGPGGFWAIVGAMTLRLAPPEKLPRAMSIVYAVGALATICAVPLGTYIGETLGWRAAFGLSAVLGLLALVAQFLTIPRLPPLFSPNLATFLEVLRRPGYRAALIAVLLAISGHFADFTYVRPFLEQTPRFGAEAISLILLAFGIGGFFGNLAAGAVMARGVRASVALGALAIGLIGAALLTIGSVPAAAAAGIGLWGFFFGFLPVSFQTWGIREASDQPEAAGALLVTAFQIAITCGAVLGGLLVDGFGSLGAIGYAAAAMLAAALFVGLSGGKEREV